MLGRKFDNSSVESKEYILRYLVFHLLEIRDQRAIELVLNFEYLEKKNAHEGVDVLIAEYDLLLSSEFVQQNEHDWAKQIRTALIMMRNVLTSDSTQFRSQLLARLRHSEDLKLRKFIEQLETHDKYIWFRPLIASLARESLDILLRINIDPSFEFRTLVIHPNEEHVYFTRDGWILVYDLLARVERRVVEIGNLSVTSLTITSSGELLCILRDKAILTVWNIDLMAELLTINLHKGSGKFHTTIRLHVIRNTHHALSVDNDGIIRRWDLETGIQLSMLAEHIEADGSLKQWVIFDGREYSLKDLLEEGYILYQDASPRYWLTKEGKSAYLQPLAELYMESAAYILIYQREMQLATSQWLIRQLRKVLAGFQRSIDWIRYWRKNKEITKLKEISTWPFFAGPMVARISSRIPEKISVLATTPSGKYLVAGPYHLRFAKEDTPGNYHTINTVNFLVWDLLTDLLYGEIRIGSSSKYHILALQDSNHIILVSSSNSPEKGLRITMYTINPLMKLYDFEEPTKLSDHKVMNWINIMLSQTEQYLLAFYLDYLFIWDINTGKILKQVRKNITSVLDSHRYVQILRKQDLICYVSSSELYILDYSSIINSEEDGHNYEISALTIAVDGQWVISCANQKYGLLQSENGTLLTYNRLQKYAYGHHAAIRQLEIQAPSIIEIYSDLVFDARTVGMKIEEVFASNDGASAYIYRSPHASEGDFIWQTTDNSIQKIDRRSRSSLVKLRRSTIINTPLIFEHKDLSLINIEDELSQLSMEVDSDNGVSDVIHRHLEHYRGTDSSCSVTLSNLHLRIIIVESSRLKGRFIHVFDLKEMKEMLHSEMNTTGDAFFAIDINEQGERLLFYITQNKMLGVINVDNLKLSSEFTAQLDIIALYPIQKTSLVISVGKYGNVKVWNYILAKCLATFSTESIITCCAIASDRPIIALGDEMGRVHYLAVEGLEGI